MGKFFHPQPGDAKSAPVKFEVPHGWIYRTFTVDGLKMEQVQNPSGRKGRVLLKLHGGGYVQGLHDRILPIVQIQQKMKLIFLG